jgi:predicted tellurium resistance membrane protein TerC
MEWIAEPQAWIALATLTALEIVLGIDNIIFISILVSQLPLQQRNKARIMGLFLAMEMRIALLLSLAWVMHLTTPLFSLLGEEISGRDIILIGGGIFLLVKSTFEIHNSIEGIEEHIQKLQVTSFRRILIQIIMLDVVFSLDSVITAIGMVNQMPVMVIAIVIAVLLMMIASRSIGEFVNTHPTVKILALSFLVLIGVTLIAEGLDVHIPKEYIYFSMAFSVTVEMLNLRIRKKARVPVKLHKSA